MAKGGARIRSGPAANPNSIRQNPDDWTALPVAGREGEAPAWPLIRPTRRELVVWASEWTRPQAVQWERLRLGVEVAVYVRVLCQAERQSSNASLVGKVMQLQNSLGLTAKGMADNRWRLDDARHATGAPQPEQPAAGGRRDRKDRLLELIVVND